MSVYPRKLWQIEFGLRRLCKYPMAMRIGGGGGLELLNQLKETDPLVPVIVITNDPSSNMPRESVTR